MTIIWIGVAIMFGGIAIAFFSMSSMVGQVQKQVEANVESAKKGEEVGARLRAVALERQKAGYEPDPTTQFERTLLIDGLAVQMQRVNVELPDSYRQLLNYLTIEELQEAVDAANG